MGVDVLRFALVAINAVAFTVVFVSSLRLRTRSISPRVRSLWLIVSVISAALLFGSAQRLALQATVLGWLPASAADEVVETWQIAQSIAVAALAVIALLGIRRLADSMAATERIAGSMLDRVRHVDIETLDLTAREREVLALIGEGELTDSELSDALHISPSTVQTHVKSLLRKTGLNRRQDLVAVASLIEERSRPGRH